MKKQICIAGVLSFEMCYFIQMNRFDLKNHHRGYRKRNFFSNTYYLGFRTNYFRTLMTFEHTEFAHALCLSTTY